MTDESPLVNDAAVNPIERLRAFKEQEAAVAEHLRLDARDADIRAQRGTEQYLLLWSIREELRGIRKALASTAEPTLDDPTPI